ncbi:MAG: hypothetical protein ACYCW6_21910 [Candidatus Xenobia bacterium]
MSKHPNVKLVEFNVEAPGENQQYAKFEQKGQGIPQVVLLNKEGQVATQWLGFQDTPAVEAALTPLLQK